MRRAVLTLAAMLVAALGWMAAGALTGWTGLDELDPLLRLGGVVLALGVAERLAARVSP